MKKWNNEITANMRWVSILIIELAVLSNHMILNLEARAMSGTTTAPTTHIVSYVHQLKKKNKNQTKPDEFPDFDFKSITGTVSGSSSQAVTQRSAMLQLYGRLVKHFDTNFDNSLNATDDSVDVKQNTLANSKEVFGQNNHHESPMHANESKEGIWSRSKQSIPVLEPVKHLVNTVRDGALNHTLHNRNHHHMLLSGMEHKPTQNESSAIETEEEREMVNESTEFKLLEVLGTIGGMIWNFFTSIQKLFAASSGSASAASSSSSSEGRR